MKKEDIPRTQDELKMPLEINSVGKHALCVNLLGFTEGKAKGRVISSPIELSIEKYRHIYQRRVRKPPIRTSCCEREKCSGAKGPTR